MTQNSTGWPKTNDFPPKPKSKDLLRIAVWLLFWPLGASAQTIPDATLGAESSVVTPAPAINGLPTSRIDGGAIRGTNLFHSFQEFNIAAGTGLYFSNPAGIENILTRITGANASNLQGTLGVLGKANLYLLNPKGILFAPGASLDLQGSFFASTGTAINFADGSKFNATSAESAPLLTVSAPVGLELPPSAAPLRLHRSVLQVPAGQSLTLAGGDMSLDQTFLNAPAGKIALNSAGDIQLSNGAVVNTSGNGAGEINLKGNRVTLTGTSQVLANTLGDGKGTGITVSANQFNVLEKSLVSASTFGTGAAGNININADSVEVAGGGNTQIIAQLLTGTFNPATDSNGLFSVSASAAPAGNININTRQLTVRDAGLFFTLALGPGRAGNVNVRASESVELRDSSLFVTGTTSTGAGGNITVNTGTLRVLNGSALSTSPSPASQGSGGNLTLTASDLIELKAVPPGAAIPSGLFTTTLGSGNAGDLSVTAGRLVAQEGAQISAAASGAGQGGNLRVNAGEVELSGISSDGRWLSGLFTSSSLLIVAGQRGSASAGDLTVNTRRLVIKDGAQVSAATGGVGAAGNLSVNASDSVEVLGFGVSTNTGLENLGLEAPQNGRVRTSISGFTTGAGNAGDLIIKTQRLIINNQAQVQVNGSGTGNAGNLQIEAAEISLNNGLLTASTASGEGGNINLETRQLQLRNNSQLSTEARGTSNGGNITIDTGTLLSLENSNIKANAFQGRGGNIQINTQGIFLSPDSLITASSQRGISGVVEIKTPDTQLQNTLTPLSAEFVSPDRLVADSCIARRNQQRGSFTVTGTGGMPSNPSEAISGRYEVMGVESLPENGIKGGNSEVPVSQGWKLGQPIQEAQGINFMPDGRVLLGFVPANFRGVNSKDIICSPDEK